MSGKLYVTAMPIGNPNDITLRALEILKKVDFVIGEEYKVASKLLKQYQIEKKIITLNEHNEKENSYDILKMLKTGANGAIITDHGTPAIADPGSFLINILLKNKIKIIPIPGVSSIITALSVSGFKIDSFIFYSKIPRKKDERKRFFRKIAKEKGIKVIIDAPYRLFNLLENIEKYYSPKVNMFLAYQLTMPNELLIKNNVKNIRQLLENKQIKKGEFILILEEIRKFKK